MAVTAVDQSAAYAQGRIDAEIAAAKECVGKLGAEKDIMMQRR